MIDLSKSGLDVSRETLLKLDLYLELLKKWNPKINLVAPSTLKGSAERHFLDSAQILKHSPVRAGKWVDLGSGGGFPGLVLAIIASETMPDLSFTLVESDLRKASFLRTVIRETNITTKVVADRIESIASLGGQVVSARALAALPKLLGFVAHHMASDGVALLPKGENWKSELEEARKTWDFSSKTHQSVTQSNAVILEIGALKHV